MNYPEPILKFVEELKPGERVFWNNTWRKIEKISQNRYDSRFLVRFGNTAGQLFTPNDRLVVGFKPALDRWHSV